MAKIGIQKEDLSKIGGDLISRGGELRTLVSNIQKLINQTQGVWDGAAAQQYLNQWNDSKKYFDDACEAVETLGKQINTYVEKMADLDQQAANQFK